MPSEGGSGKLDLRAVLEDSPKIQSHIASLEGCISPLKDYTTLLRDTCRACCLHQRKLCKGTDALSRLVSSLQPELLEEEGSGDNTLATFSQLGRYLNELHSCQDMLCSQLESTAIFMLSNFLSEDIAKLEKLKECYDSAKQEHEQAMSKYSRTSKKRDSEKTRFEANAELYGARRKFYQSSLEYCTELRAFQLKRKYCLLEPLLTLMHAQASYFKVAHNVLSGGFGELLTALHSEVQSYHVAHEAEMEAMAAETQELELQFPNLCIPDPDPTDPFSEYQPPNLKLTSKAGYLFQKIQRIGPGLSRWERAYFYTKDGLLFVQTATQKAELLLQLTGAEASAGEMDDRRYVLQVTHPSIRRPLTLAAESEVSRDEWMAAVNNIAAGEAPQGELGNSVKDAEAIRLERERIRLWVDKAIHEPAKKSKTTRSQSQASLSAKEPQSKPEPPVTTRKSPLRSLMLRKREQPIEQPVQPVPLLGIPETGSDQPTEGNGGRPRGQTESNGAVSPSPTFSETFSVKQLGSADVFGSPDAQVVKDAVRKVMAARSLKNVKPPINVELLITHKHITLSSTGSKKILLQIQLKDILYCSIQPGNERLFGILLRTTKNSSQQKFLCHVFEAGQSGKPICSAITEAIQTAWSIVQSKSGRRSTVSTSTGEPPQQQQQALTAFTPDPLPASDLQPNSHTLLSVAAPMQRMKPAHSTGTLSNPECIPAPSYRSSSDSNLPALVELRPHSPAHVHSTSFDDFTPDTSTNSSSSDLTFKVFERQDNQPLIMLESPPPVPGMPSQSGHTSLSPLRAPPSPPPQPHTQHSLIDLCSPPPPASMEECFPSDPFHDHDPFSLDPSNGVLPVSPDGGVFYQKNGHVSLDNPSRR